MVNFNNKSGFSILEIMVVVSVVMIGFIGILVLAEQTIKFRSINQRSLIAAQLAQEGIEITRYYRNLNWLGQNKNLHFSNNLTNDNNHVTGNKKIFAVDFANRTDNPKEIVGFYDQGEVDGLGLNCENDRPGDQTLLDCYLKSGKAKLYLDTDPPAATPPNNTYRMHDSATGNPPAGYVDSGFSRLIETVYYENDPDDDEDDYLYVISRVYWEDRGKDYYYTIATYLFDYDWYIGQN